MTQKNPLSISDILRQQAVKQLFKTAVTYLEQNRSRIASDKDIETILNVFNSGLKVNITQTREKLFDLLMDFCRKEAE